MQILVGELKYQKQEFSYQKHSSCTANVMRIISLIHVKANQEMLASKSKDTVRGLTEGQ